MFLFCSHIQVDAKTEKKLQMYQEQVTSLKKQIQEEQNKTKAAKDDLKEFKSAGAGDVSVSRSQKKLFFWKIGS